MKRNIITKYILVIACVLASGANACHIVTLCVRTSPEDSSFCIGEPITIFEYSQGSYCDHFVEEGCEVDRSTFEWLIIDDQEEENITPETNESGTECYYTFNSAGLKAGVLFGACDNEDEGSGTVWIPVLVVNDLTVSPSQAVIGTDEVATITANPQLSGYLFKNLLWKCRYRESVNDDWGSWHSVSGNPDNQTATLQTSTPGYYQYTAQHGTGDTGEVLSPVITVEEVVVVDRVILAGSNPENLGPIDGLTGFTHYLEAKPDPSTATFPSGEPTWSVTGPAGSSPTVNAGTVSGMTVEGAYTVTAKCGSSDDGDSFVINAWDCIDGSVSIECTSSDDKLYLLGDNSTTLSLKATALDSDETELTGGTYTWEISSGGDKVSLTSVGDTATITPLSKSTELGDVGIEVWYTGFHGPCGVYGDFDTEVRVPASTGIDHTPVHQTGQYTSVVYYHRIYDQFEGRINIVGLYADEVIAVITGDRPDTTGGAPTQDWSGYGICAKDVLGSPNNRPYSESHQLISVEGYNTAPHWIIYTDIYSIDNDQLWKSSENGTCQAP